MVANTLSGLSGKSRPVGTSMNHRLGHIYYTNLLGYWNLLICNMIFYHSARALCLLRFKENQVQMCQTLDAHVIYLQHPPLLFQSMICKIKKTKKKPQHLHVLARCSADLSRAGIPIMTEIDPHEPPSSLSASRRLV